MPSLERAVERTGFGKAQEVTDLSDRERCVREKPFRRLSSLEVDDLLIRRALGGESALQRARRSRELLRDRVNGWDAAGKS